MSYRAAVIGLVLAGAIATIGCSARTSAVDDERLVRLRVISLAVLNFESAFEILPFLRRPGSKGKLSWRVRIWPFVEGNSVYDGTVPTEDFNSERNSEYANQMPKYYGQGSPSHSDVVWVRPTTDIYYLRDITDGPANTIMLVQGIRKVPWMEPVDVTVDDVLEYFERLGPNDSLFVACYDGLVHRIPRSIDAGELKKMLDPTDGQPVHWPDEHTAQNEEHRSEQRPLINESKIEHNQ